MAGLLDFIGNNAGSLLGGLFGAGASGDTKTGATQSRDPWGPAQPHILRNLQNEADLQSVYQKNPFNAQQQAGYNNIFADADHFRSSVAPGLMDFANRGTTGSYERQRGGAPGSAAGYGGESRPGGFRAGGQGPFSVAPYVSAAQASMASTGPMRDGSAPPTVSPSGGRFGQVDFAASNPYTNGAIKTPEPKAQEAMAGGLLGGGRAPTGGNGGNGGQSPSDSNFGGIGIGDHTDKLTQNAMDTFSTYAPISAVGAAVAALVQQGMGVQQALDAVNSTADPIAALNALQQWTASDPSYSFYSGESTGGNGRGDGDANAGMGYGQGFGGSGWGGTTTGGY